MTPPDEEDRPGDPKTTGATPHQHHDQQATRPDGADCRPSARVDSGGAVEISFAELLARLGYGTHLRAKHEHISVCHQIAGGSFASEVGPWDHAPGLVKYLIDNHYPRDFWYSVNALGEVTHGRGKESDVIRLTSLYADLDIKAGACPDLQTAVEIIEDVSGVLGERPSAVTDSGHGLHPYWPIDVESARTLTNREAKGLLERFGRLMKAIAAHHGCEVDSVFDLARVLRVPGTTNHKTDPVPVWCLPDTGKPLSVEAIRAALDQYGIIEDRPRVRVSANGQGPAPEEHYSRTCLINRVAKSARGSRNKTLFGAVMDAAKQGDLDDEMIEALEGAADECGLSWEDGWESVRKTMESAIHTAESQGYEPDGNPWTATKTRASFRRHSASRGEQEATDDEGAGEDREADFWAQRDTFAHVHRFTRSRRAAPYAVLASALRRAITLAPPYVQLPAIVGSAASVNMFTVNVGRSGQGKDIANGVGRDAVVFLNAEGEVLADPDSPGIGSGEGLARVFKGYGGQDQPPACVHVEINEVSTLTALADRKGHTLVGELLKAFMGQAIGFSNAQKATTTHVRAHSYRLCLSIGAQPENASFFLDREKDGLPQRFLWLPVVNPYALPPTDDEQESVPALRVTLPEFPTLVEGAPYLVGVPASARAMIRDFHYLVEIGSPDVDPLDGHLMLVRLKVAFGLALLEGRPDITEDDWRIAGQLIELSNGVRADMRRVVADCHRKSNTARAHDQADREAIISEMLSEKNQQRVVSAITRKLSRVGSATRRELHQACDSSISRDFPAVFDFMSDRGDLVDEGGEGIATRYRLRSV